MINICGCGCIPGAKHGMLELIPQTLFFLERASANTEGGSGYPRLSRYVSRSGAYYIGVGSMGALGAGAPLKIIF